MLRAFNLDVGDHTDQGTITGDLEVEAKVEWTDNWWAERKNWRKQVKITMRS